MQVVYAPLGAQLLPTPPTVYKGFTYWVHGQIDAYRYVICPPKGEGKGPIISDSAYQSIIVANQEARRAIDLLTATRTKSKQPKSKSDRPE